MKESKNEVAQLLKAIDFSAVNVVQAAAENPTLFVRAAEYRLTCLRARNAAKMEWEKAQAETDLAIRREARLTGDKITEALVSNQVTVNSTVAHYAVKFSEADELDEFSKLIIEAFRMRRDCLRIVGELTRDELSLARATEAGAEKLAVTRRKLKERFPGK